MQVQKPFTVSKSTKDKGSFAQQEGYNDLMGRVLDGRGHTGHGMVLLHKHLESFNGLQVGLYSCFL